MGLKEKIDARADKIYKERYGKRKDISSEETSKVIHDAAMEVQREIKEQQKEK